jgi:CRP-like cAMP-binding protein
MKRDQHHQNAGAFAEKGDTVQTSADRQDYVDFLEVIPTFSSCTRKVLKEFVTLDMIKVGCAAGEVLPEIHQDQNLYVLVAGSAILDAGDDVLIALEPGDYFGRISARRHLVLTSVLAVSDIELLVINPHEVAQLEQASSRDRHPSEIEWRIELPTTTKRVSRRNHRRSVLASQGVQ